MKKSTKIWLIVAILLVLVGCIIFGGVMTMFKWDFTKLSTVEYETNDYVINEYYENISIVTDTSDVVVIPSDDLITSVVCYEENNLKHTVMVDDNTLVINLNDTRKWYEYIGINFGTSKITLYIPQREYGSLSIKSNTGDVEVSDDFKFENIDISVSTGDVDNYASASEIINIKTSTGDINLENLFADTVELSVSTGRVAVSDVICDGDVKINVSTGNSNISNVRCKNIISNGSTGKIFLKNVIASEKLSIDRSTGDVSFESCDASEIVIKTSTGDVKGNLLTDKVFITQTDTGSVDVPKIITGGICDITTDTGDIKVNILY